MKILITGGAGFLGSNLAYRYANNKENEVYIVDNLSTGKIDNIEELILKEKVYFLEEDICNNKIAEFIKNNKFDYIYNFACPASPKYYLEFPIETWNASILGVKNILDAIKGSKTKMLQTSTSEIYGNALQTPQDESYFGNVNCIGVRACYDEGKRAAETLIFDHKRLYGTDIRVVRIFNTYGEKMNSEDGRIISNFINQAINNEDITIYGSGNQTRSFCYIEDTLDAIIALMELPDPVEFPINVGNPSEIKVLEVAKLVKEMTNSKSNIVFCKEMKDDPQRRKPNISCAIEILKWRPKVSLEEGLKKCIEYYGR